MCKRLSVIISVLFAFLMLPKTVLGFGITPAEIYVEQLKPGTRLEREVYITRPVNEVDEKLNVVLEPNLGEMDGWFSYIPGREFEFPEGKNTTSFKVVVNVPKGIELKEYKGQITAKGISDKKAPSGVTIIKGAVLGVNVVASSVDVYDLEVLSIEAPDVNSGDPVRLLINIENTGNTAIAPDNVYLDVMDLFEKPIESLSDTSLEEIDAFSKKEIQAEFNSDLEVGQYRVDASVVFMGEEIARKKMVLTVNAKPAKVGEDYVQKGEGAPQVRENFTLLIFVALGIFLMALAAIIKILRASEKSDESSGKVMNKLMRYKKLLAVILAVVAIVAMAYAVYYYLSLSSPKQVKKTVEKSVSKQEGVTPTSAVSDETSEGPSPTSEKEVKGVSTESEEAATPLIVNKPGSPGRYPVYARPDFTSEIVFEAEDGVTFDVVKKNGDWYEVTLADGVSSGWLHETSINKKK